MRQLFFIPFISVFLSGVISAQSSWIGGVSTSWNNAGNWTAGVPTSAVDAIIGDVNFTGGFQPTVNANSACKSLTIGNAAKISSITIARNLSVSGSVTIGSNGTVLANTANRTITLSGNWSNSGTYSATVASALVAFSGTTPTLTGTTTFRRMSINAGCILTLANNIIVNDNLSVSGTINPTEFYTISGTGALTVNAGGKIFVMAADYASNYSITGTVTLSGTSTVQYASATINQNVTNTLTYGYLRISGGLTKYLIGNLPVLSSASATSGRIYVDAGTFDLQSYTANRGTTVAGGSVIVSNAASLKIGGTNTFPSNYNTKNLSAASNVEYSGTNQTVLAATYGNLILSSGSGASVKTMPATAMTIAGGLTGSIGNGTSVSFTAGANITVNRDVSLDAATTFGAGSFTHTFKGNWSNAGLFSGSTSSVIFSGTSAVLSGTGTNNFNNLTFSGLGVTATAATSINVSGNLATTGSGTFVHTSGGTLTMSGSAKTISGNGLTLGNCIITGTITTAANVKISGDFTTNGAFAASAGTITLIGSSKIIAGSGTITFFSVSVSGSISTSGDFTMLSNMSVAIAGSFTATGGTVTFNNTSVLSGTANLYNVTINSAKTLRLGASSVLGIANIFTKSGTLNVTTTVPNTVQYNGSGAQNIVGGTAAGDYDNLILLNAGTKTAIANARINNDFTISTGVTFNAATYTFSLYRHWTNNGIFTASTSDVQLRGTNAANISGVTNFYNLTENKSNSLIWVTLLDSIVVANNLTTTSGNLTTGVHSVTVNGNRLGTGTGVILGTIRQTHAFTNGTTYYFEGPHNRLVFTSPSGLTSVTVKVTLGEISDFDPTYESILREYEITVPTGTYTNAALRLHYQDNELNAFDEPNLSEYKYNSGITWDSIGNTSRDVTLNYVEKAGITMVSGRWTLSGTRNVVRWDGSASSAWADLNNWTTISGSNMSNRVPTLTDAAEIGQGTFTNNPTITSAQTVNVLRYGSVQASTLTISSGSLTTVGSIRGEWSGSASHTLDVSSGALTVGTNFELSDGTSGHEILLRIGSGSAAISYDLTQRASGGIDFTGNGILTIGGLFNYSAGNFTAGSGTVVYTGGENQVVAPVIYNNLSFTKSTERAIISSPTIVNGSLTTSVGGELAVSDTLTVTGNITIGAGNTFLEMGSRINVGGNWTTNGTFTVSNGSVNFNGSSDQSVNTNIFNTLYVNKSGGTLSLTGDLTLNNNLTITSGTLDLSIYTADRSNPGGIFTMDAGSALKLAGTSNFPANFITNTLDAASTVEYNGTIAQNVADLDYGNLTFSNGGAVPKTLVGNMQINGNLLINSGATIDASSYNHVLYGNFTNNGTYTASTSTLILNGVSKTFTGNTIVNNLTSITGSYTFTSSTLGITGDLFCDTGGALNFGNTAITHDGDFTNKGSLSSTGILTFTGTRVQTFQLINAVSSASTGVVNFNGTVAPVTNSSNSTVSFATININNSDPAGISMSSPWTVAVACNIASGSTVNFGSLTHTFLGNFTNNGTVTSSGELRFTPVFSGSTVTLDATGGSFTSTGKVVFGGTYALAIADNTPAFNNVDITNTNSATVTAPNNWTIGQDMLIQSGATFNGGIATSHTISGNLTNNGTLIGNTSTITFTGSPAYIDGVGSATYNNLTIATGADLTLNKSISISGNLVVDGNFITTGRVVTFTGTNPSTISGAAGLVTFDDLDQNKTNSTTTLLVPVIAANELTLLGGIINTTATNILTLNDNAISTSGSATSFVNGPMIKIGDDPFIFPVGKAGTPNIWARIEMVNDANFLNYDPATSFKCEYFNTTPIHNNDPLYKTAGVDHASGVEYWNLERISDPGNDAQCNVSLYWEDATRSGIISNADLRVVHFAASTSNKWENQGGTGVGGTTGYITSTIPLTNFSPTTFGSGGGTNPLPVELLSFTAIPNSSNQVELKWITASETNNDYFTVERSADGINFSLLFTIKGAGSSGKELSYSGIDELPLIGSSYYRLKQTDFDGKFTYPKIVNVNFQGVRPEFMFSIFPQPVKAGSELVLYFTNTDNEPLLVTVYDIAGKEYFSGLYNPNHSNNYVISSDVTKALTPGIYFISAYSENNRFKQKMIIE